MTDLEGFQTIFQNYKHPERFPNNAGIDLDGTDFPKPSPKIKLKRHVTAIILATFPSLKKLNIFGGLGGSVG